MKFKITDNQSGKTLTISGDKAPTEQEAEQLFQSSGIREQAPKQGILQSQAIPVGGAALGGVVGSILGPVGAGVGAGAGYVGGDVIRKLLGNLTGQQNQPSNVGQNIGETALGGVLSGATGLAGGAIGKAVAPVVTAASATKSLSPIKIASWLRDQAAGKAGDITTKGLIDAADKFVERNPLAKETWDVFKPTIAEKMPAKELLARMTQVFGQAYTRGGAVKDSAQGELMNQLYQASKGALKEQAPEVAKYTSGMRQILTAPKQIQSLAWLLAKLGLAKGVL